MVQFVALDVGATLAYWSRDPARLLDDLAAARPTHFPSVPRVFEKVHTKALAAAEEASPVRRHLFRWAIATGAKVRAAERRGDPVGRGLRARHRLADRLVLARAGCSAARCGSDSPVRRRSAARCSSSSTPAAC